MSCPKLVSLLLVGLVAASCSASQEQLRIRAAYDLACPKEQLSVEKVARHRYAVEGCDRRKIYVERCSEAPGSFDPKCMWATEPRPQGR